MVRLIEENMDMDVGVVKLATLIGSGLLILLKMVTITTNSLLFWAFHIKRLEASYMSGWRKVVYKDYRKDKGGARNIKLTDDMQAFIRDEQEKLYNSLSPPSPRLVRNWRFASQTRQFQTSYSVSQPGTFKTSSSPSRLLETTAMYRMKEIIPTQSSDVFNTPHGWST